MRPTNHPDFVYQPWSDERRAEASRRAKERFSGKPGHSRVYGMIMPDALARVLRPLAYEIARRDGGDAAMVFIEQAMARWEGRD